MATMAFNRAFTRLAARERDAVYCEKAGFAQFDCRAFNLAKEEVANYLYWRQADATRNSIQMVGQANFSHRELQNRSCSEIQDMLMLQKGINWNNFSVQQKRGSCCRKEAVSYTHLDVYKRQNVFNLRQEKGKYIAKVKSGYQQFQDMNCLLYTSFRA